MILLKCNNPYDYKEYQIDVPMSKIENSLKNINDGFGDSLMFVNVYNVRDRVQVGVLNISPKNWASIEFVEVKTDPLKNE